MDARQARLQAHIERAWRARERTFEAAFELEDVRRRAREARERWARLQTTLWSQREAEPGEPPLPPV